jgi:hypothetical protein
MAMGVAIVLLVTLSAPNGAGAEPRSDRDGIECTTTPSSAENVVLDCPSEYSFPTDETSLEVDPNDPDHMVSASIDGAFGDQTIEFATTFDGGETWTIGDIPHGPNTQNFDPGVTFDAKRGTVLITFEYEGQHGAICVPPPEHAAQLVTTSSDGGLHWSEPVEAFIDSGCFGFTREVLLFGAEVKISADNDPASEWYGRIWLVGAYTACKPCDYSKLVPLPIAEIRSDDGGATWTQPAVVSGASTQYCTVPPDAPDCDLSQPSTAVLVTSDGSAYVAFVNYQNKRAWESGEIGEGQVLAVRSTDGGETWSPPTHVVDLEDGGRDYDCSSGYFGCRLSGTNLCPSCGEISTLAADANGTLYLAFYDNRNGVHDVDNPISNTDVFLMTSADNGQTWSGPSLVDGAPGDQFKPSLAMNPVTGELGVLFYDRTNDPSGKTMNVTLATGLPGSFDLQTITTAPSHLNGDLWDQTTLPDCKFCVFHIGEYIGLSYGSDGTANMTWADLRHLTTGPDGRKGYTMNVDFAREESGVG